MSGLPASSGSCEFDRLRDALAVDRQLRNELEAAALLTVETYNPSDRGVRFITGGIGEWILTMVAYAAGVLALPAGHNEDGVDLVEVLEQGRRLWSAKGSNSPRGTFTISNGQGGSGSGLIHPTVFWSPGLPGYVFVDPKLHREVVEAQIYRSDAVVIQKSAVAEHADSHPACVAEFLVPVNPRTAKRDPSFEAVKILIEGGNFPRLRRILEDGAKSESTVVSQLRELTLMKESGQLSQQQFDLAVAKVVTP